MTTNILIDGLDFQLYFLSERALTIQFGNSICEVAFDKITHLNQIIHQSPFIGFETTLIAYTTLTIFYEPTKVLSTELAGETCFEKLSNYIHQLYRNTGDLTKHNPKCVEIPVCYDRAFGLDLNEIAAHCKLSIKEVIEIHSKALYTVYMIGFVPGFAYMGGMSKQLTTPRKAHPRSSIAAGAVGIAGEQTGIYPLTTPGGWQILGQTPTVMFNFERAQPSLLQAGDRVIFKPIDMEEFQHLSSTVHED